jgi:hypothetical protein
VISPREYDGLYRLSIFVLSSSWDLGLSDGAHPMLGAVAERVTAPLRASR